MIVEMIKRVKVVKASGISMWYESYIDKNFFVEKEEHDRVWVREGGDYNLLNYILKSDIEIID